MRKIRIAQIGIGHAHATAIFGCMKGLPEVFEIVGWYAPESDIALWKSGASFAGDPNFFRGYPQMTLEEILNDPTIEAVTVETEEKYMVKYAQMAIDAGKAVHMDKPGGYDLAEFEKLIATAKEKDAVLSFGYMYRFNKALRSVLGRIREGEFGKVLSVEGQMNCWHGTRQREWLATVPGGNMFFLNCHMLDLVMLIMGGEPTNIRPLNCATGRNGSKAIDYAMVMLDYPTGPSFIKSCDTEKGGFVRRYLTIVCEHATIELKPLEFYPKEDGTMETTATIFLNSVRLRGESQTFTHRGRYDTMMVTFARRIVGEVGNPYSYDRELVVYKALRKCCEMED